jgi:hypothetical protein
MAAGTTGGTATIVTGEVSAEGERGGRQLRRPLFGFADAGFGVDIRAELPNKIGEGEETWPSQHLLFCFCRRAYLLHQRKAATPEPHKSSKRVRAMLPAFAARSSGTMRLFNSACSRTAPN